MSMPPPSPSTPPPTRGPRATIVPELEAFKYMTDGLVEARKAIDQGLLYAAVVMAYVVTDGVLNFVCERRKRPECCQSDYLDQKASCLRNRGALSDAAHAAVMTIFGNTDERNDFIHFNATVQARAARLHETAVRKCNALEALLTDLFTYTREKGVVSGTNRDLWPPTRAIKAHIDFTESGEEAQHSVRPASTSPTPPHEAPEAPGGGAVPTA